MNTYTPPLQKSEWTFEENKQFEIGLVAFDHDSPDLFEKIGSRIKAKTIEQIREHYEELVRDIKMIESGNCDIFTFSSSPVPIDHNNKSITTTTKQVQLPRRKVNKWSHEEHRNFLIGLERHGKGDWKRISRDCVKSRTPTQVASHAQKYFLKQQHRNDRDTQNANTISNYSEASTSSRDAAMATMVQPCSISGPRVVYIADQHFLAPHFSCS